jgi:hypothetical protein
MSGQRDRLVRDMAALWPLLDFARLPQTYPAWSAAVTALIVRDRASVTRQTFAYLDQLKAVEVGGRADLVEPDPLDEEALATSLRVTTIVPWFRGMKVQALPGKWRGVAFSSSSGMGTRYVLNAGRSTVANSVRADRRGTGYERRTSSHPCEFCSDLSGKFARAESSVDFPAHDHCLCSAEPVYR